MPYNPITNNEIAVKQPIRQELMQKIKDNFDYFYGSMAAFSGGDGGVPNGSFEIDSDSDGIPDQWTRYLYPNGSAAFETTNPVHGSKAYKFTHPGGAGNGGGYLESDYIEIPVTQKTIQFVYWATAAGIKVICELKFYNASKTLLSSTQPYVSTSNPTRPTLVFITPLMPASARYMKIVLIGGYPDTNVAATVYFDDVRLIDNAIPTPMQLTETINQSDVSSSLGYYVDVGSPWSVNIPNNVSFLNIVIELAAAPSGDFIETTYARFRIGSLYSSEASTISTSYYRYTLSLNVSTLSGSHTVIFQLKAPGTGNPAYLRSPSSLPKYYTYNTVTISQV